MNEYLVALSLIFFFLFFSSEECHARDVNNRVVKFKFHKVLKLNSQKNKYTVKFSLQFCIIFFLNQKNMPS